MIFSSHEHLRLGKADMKIKARGMVTKKYKIKLLIFQVNHRLIYKILYYFLDLARRARSSVPRVLGRLVSSLSELE